MINSVSHIGIAVNNLNESIDKFKKIFDINEVHREIIESQKVEIASFNIGNVRLELTASIDDTSPIKKFINNHGEGIHHIGFNTDDIISELERLKQAGFQLINKSPVQGANNNMIAFMHPKSTSSVLIEICQKP